MDNKSLIGATIEGKYQVIEHIGRGGMADVWSARDMRLRRMVAIKTIAAGLTHDMNPVALFEKEAQTIAGMEHPHILPIFSFGNHEGSLYIVMRYVTGGSLEDVLEDGAMDADDVLRIGQAVGQALDYAHQNNIIHLDLKPGNILLDSNDAPYLADFGLATVLDPEGRAKNPGSGTLLYMAPEQLVSDMIDYRADVYSFCIMLYHMFTGQLPFEGTVPLAMKQLQNGQNLPDVTDINPDLHDGLTEILRLGTAQDAKLRPDTHADVIEQLRDLFTPITVANMTDMGMAGLETGGEISSNSKERERLRGFEDLDLLEAFDIYERARKAWAGGHGRFLPGLTHYMIMSDYYMQADYYGLAIDDSGYQMLLRGALEFDYELDTWWGELHNQDARRRVCLHTLRSGTAPARIRALKRLEYLPDDEINPSIPRLVSQALEVEGDNNARIAALNTLRIRAKAIQRYKFDDKAKPNENTMLDSMVSQLGIQLVATSDWQEVIYSDEVDELIAKTALDTTSDEVAEFAARTIGEIQSLTAVRYVAAAAHEKRRGALEALALIRDETTSLPDDVDRQARLYAWLMNTLRRTIDRPLDGILRFVLILLGAWIGMGEIIYVTFNASTLFNNQRWMYSISVGIVIGLFITTTLMVSDEFSRRLSGFWQWWLRLLVSGLFGIFMSIMTWGAFTWLFLFIEPEWNAMRLAGVALAFVFVTTGMLNLTTWRAILFAAPIAWLPAFALFHKYYFPDTFVATPAPLIGLLIGVLVGWLASRRAGMRVNFELTQSPQLKVLAGGLPGFGVVMFIWQGVYVPVIQGFPAGNYLTWDGVLSITLLMTFFGMLMSYVMRNTARLAFVATSIAGFVAFFVSTGEATYFRSEISRELLLVNFAPPTIFNETVPLIYIVRVNENWHMIFTVILPMFFVIMLGAYGRDVLRGWWQFIGPSFRRGERGGWLTGMLAYALPATGLLSILSIFNMHVDIAWAIGWSLWGFFTFVFALATWRRALWGARGLVLMMILLIGGGFLYDLRGALGSASGGEFPPLLDTATILLHPGNPDGGNLIATFMLQTPVIFVTGLVALLLTVRAVYLRNRFAVPILLIVVALMTTAAMVQQPIQISLPTMVFWSIWAVVLGVLSIMAYRRMAWASIALLFMGPGWVLLALFTPVQESMAVLAMTHMALLVYALQPAWAIMERGRFRMPTLFRQVEAETIVEPEADAEVETTIEDAVVQEDDEAIVPLPETAPVPESYEVYLEGATVPAASDEAMPILETNTDMIATAPLPGEAVNEDDNVTEIKFDSTDLAFPHDEDALLPETALNLDEETGSEDDEPAPGKTTPRIRLNTDSDQTKPRIRISTEQQLANRITQPAPIKLDTGEEKLSDADSPEQPVSRPRIRINTEPQVNAPETGMQPPDASDDDPPEKAISRPRIRINTQPLPDVENDGEETEDTPESATAAGTRIKLNLDNEAEQTKPRIRLNTEADPNTDKRATSRMKLDTGTFSETRSTKPRIKLNLDSEQGQTKPRIQLNTEADPNTDEKATSRIKLDMDSLSESSATKPRISLNPDEGKPGSSKGGSSLRIKLDDVMNPENTPESDAENAVEDETPDDER